MSKGITIVLAFVWIMASTNQASAHVLVKDQITSAGAILHVNPDDDPIAGEQASLFFELQGSVAASAPARAEATITNERGVVTGVPTELRGTSVAVHYVFPYQGLYRVQLVINQNNKPVHKFLQSQRVSRGIIGDTVKHAVPAWAGIGTIFTVVATACTAIVAFNRRKAIRRYSKL